MDKHIIDLIKGLNCNNSIKEQEKAIKQLVSRMDYDLKLLIQPKSKEFWLNSAKVISLKGYTEYESVIDMMFEWLQDMNWPGAEEIKETLQTIPKDKFLVFFESSVDRAIKANDSEWCYSLAQFIKIYDIQSDDFRDKELFRMFEDILSNYE